MPFTSLQFPCKSTESGPKNHDSQRHDRILRCFIHPEIGQFSPHLGAISLLNCTYNLEKREKNPLEKFQINPVEAAP